MNERIRKRIVENREKKLIKMYEYNINWIVSKEEGVIKIRNWSD